MSDTELWAAWRLWVLVAAAIIVVAAALLITIWLTARAIYAHAVRALVAARKIREQTQPIWALQSTNEVAAELRDTVQRIEQKGGALVTALEAHAGTGGR
jgi:HAMP domain-containing protein